MSRSVAPVSPWATRLRTQLLQLIPEGLLNIILDASDGGSTAVAHVDDDCDTPELVWTSVMRRRTAAHLDKLSSQVPAFPFDDRSHLKFCTRNQH
jgi:hypothetical protein